MEKPGSGYEFSAKKPNPDLVDMKRIHTLWTHAYCSSICGSQDFKWIHDGFFVPEPTILTGCCFGFSLLFI